MRDFLRLHAFVVVFAFVLAFLVLVVLTGLGLARVQPVKLVELLDACQFTATATFPMIVLSFSWPPEGVNGETRSIVSAAPRPSRESQEMPDAVLLGPGLGRLRAVAEIVEDRGGPSP